MISTQIARQSSVDEMEPDQEMLESTNELCKLIETQIALQYQNSSNTNSTEEAKLTLPKFELDKRMRAIISFFISNKKLINVFIRVN